MQYKSHKEYPFTPTPDIVVNYLHLATTTPTPPTCGPMTDASLDEDCSNARCVAVNSSCVTTSAGSRRCACVNKNVQISATECSLGPSVLSSTPNYVFSTNQSRTSVTVGTIIFDGLSTFPTNNFSIEGEVYPDERILDLRRNSSNIDVALVKEISNAKTFVVALRATSGEFTVQQVVTVRITSSSFTPENVTVMLVEGTRKGTLIADVRTIGSLGGYSNFEMETTDQTARALFNVTTSGQVLCGQDIFLSDFTNNDTVAKEYIFSIKAKKGGQRETTATFYILLFKSTFTTTLRENWKGNILSYTITSSKFQVAINDTLPDRLKFSKDLMIISLVEEIDYDAGITSIHFKLDLVTTTKSTTVDVHINIEDQNDESPKFKKAVYVFSLLAGSKGNSVVGVVDVTDGDTVGQTTFSLEGRNKDDFSINDDGVLTSKVDLTRGRFPSEIPLRVKAYDGVSYSEEANITVYLISYTINAVNLNKTFHGRVSENSTGAFVANVAVSNYTGYKFPNPQADRFFSLNSTSGNVTTTIGLDRENDDQAYTAFTIQAYLDSGDQCSPVTIGQLITNITDVNDNAPEFSSPSYTGRVKENSIPGTLVVGLVDIAVTDEDAGVNGSVNFALTGPGKTYFAVEKLNHNQFTIKTSGTPIDREFEVTPYVVLTLTGTDNPSNPNTGTTALNITIMDVNDNAPQFNGGSTVFWVEENVGPKTITTLTATDRDEGLNAKVSYSLKDGGFGFFQVNESTGEVSTIKAIDREKRKVFNLIIEAKDQGSPSLESELNITVNIRDVNDEKPTFTEKYYKGSYTENSPCDRSILTVSATDHDEGINASITFSTTSSNFTVNNTTGAIGCAIPLDYEEMQQHLIEIKAENPGFPTMSDTVKVEINVEDENDNSPRFDKPNYQSEITTWEWVTNNPVDVFEVTDDDSGTNGLIILSMSGETDKFYIDGDTVGVLRIKEGASQPVASTTYNFDVTATDKGSPSLSVTVPVSVDVKKIQGNSTVRFSSKDYTFSIVENRLYTTSFGRANAAHDANVSVHYTLIHGGDFRIDPSSGALTCSKAQDRETVANHTMVVRARDITTNASDVAVVTVQILDVNDNRPIFLASSGQLVFQVKENSTGKEIGRIIAKDGDADENGTITYSIVSQTPRTHFSINSRTGTVTVSGDLDREDYDTYNLIIKATDNGDAPRTATTSATILVLDINDNPPEFQTTYAVTVKEDSAISASVETVSATDRDLAQHGAIVYTSNTVMVNGTFCPFHVSVETGVVKVSGDLDYETTSTYECIVTAVDMKGCSNCTGRLTGSTTMSVTILDFNDNPPVFQGAPYRANISRDANINTLVTDVITATDRDGTMDGNGVVKYHMFSNINYFRIDRDSGRIFVASTLDKVNDDEVTLRIKATDLPQKDPAMEAITNITISILTDQPRPFFNKTYTFLLTENEKPDEDKPVSIRAYARRSSEEACNCTYDLIDNSSFYIDSMTGDLRQKDPIDREKTGSRFYLRVKATDRRSLLYRTTDVEVNVTDVNDNLPYFNNTQQNFIVNQSAPAGHVIGRVMSVDADELSHPKFTNLTHVEGIELLRNGTLVVRASLSNYTEVDMIVSVTEGNFTGPINILAVTTTKVSIEVRPDDYIEHAPVFGKATTTPTPSTCDPMTDASLDEDCSNARCVAVNSSCVTTSAGSRRCACANKNVQISATECSMGPSVLSSTKNYIFSTDLSRTPVTVGSIMFDGLSTFPTNTFSIEGEVYPDEGILDLKRNSRLIDVALVKEISSAKTFVVALRAASSEFTVQQVVTVRIKSSSFTPEDVTVMLVEGTRKGTLIADVRTIGSLGGYSNFEMETTDQTARALFNVTISGQVLCGQDMFLSDFTNNDTVAKEYIFSVKATNGGQRATTATFYILLFKSTFTTTFRENWTGKILSYTITSPKFEVAIIDTLPDGLAKSLTGVRLEKAIDYDAGVRNIDFKLDLVTTNSTKSTTVDVHIKIEDLNDEPPKLKKAVYEFSLFAGSKRNSIVGVVDVTDGDTVGRTAFDLDGENKGYFSINDDGILTSKVDLTRGKFPSTITLRVKAYDGVTYSDESTITVYLISYTIHGINLNKTFLGRVSENSPNGTYAANVSVSNYTDFKFANPRAQGFFNLNPASGIVTTAIGLDRENDDQAYTEFTIQAYMDSGDQCSPVTIGHLITNVTDENDNAPQFSRPFYTGRVKENSTSGTLVDDLVDIVVTDEDRGVNGSVNFALTGSGKTYFAVEKLNHNKFTIKTSGTPTDREVTPYVVLTLTGTDNPSNPNTGTTTLNITIMDVNDNAPQFNRGRTVFWVEENVGPKIITTLTATDKDEGLNAKISYSLKDGGFGLFQIDEITGEVSTIKAIDRESRKVFNLSIEARDQGSPSLESVLTVTINIRDVNDEKPTFTKNSYKSYNKENSPCDRNILTVTAIDQDEGSNANITFSTTSSKFTVDPISGAIRCMIPLDYEEMRQHLIEIKAENPGFPKMSDTVTVEINVEDENDNSPRFDKPNYQSEITTLEWATNNPVDVFEVTDDDSGTNGQFRFSMSGETDKFYIDGDTIGVLRIKEGASQPNAYTTYNFNVTAIDKGSRSLNVSVPVSVVVKKSQGNSTVRFNYTDFIFSIEEEKVYNTSFGRAKASYDASVTVSYTLIHGGDFRINNSSGALTCSKAQDRETAAKHTIVVRARDPATNASDVAVITVIVSDINDNAPTFRASTEQLVFSVQENSPGKEVARIVADDRDVGENGTITYSIESQIPRTHFSINPENGTVTVSGHLDREAYDTYNLIIKATDNADAPRTATTSATILVDDINDNPPTFQTLHAVTVKEDSAISVSVATVSATDRDYAQHGKVTYFPDTVMVNGTVCPFKVSVETGVVKVSGDLDYETTSTYECIVTAVDMKGCSNCTGRLTGSTTMSVTILDFNDNPPVFQGAPYRANVTRDADINTLVTDVITATDRDDTKDGNGVVKYHILSSVDYFEIDRDSGSIYVASTLDTVNDDVVTLRIKATDLPQKDPAMEAITNITISILTDEPRPFFTKTYTFMLTENEKPDEDKAVSIRASVRRASEEECNCTYDLIGSDNSSFYIDSMTGDLRQKDPIDREKTGSRFYVRVKATDRRSLLYRTTDVEVNVKDVNDNLPYFNNTQQNFTVNQNVLVDHVIGRVISVDADELSHPIYTAFDVEGIELLGDGTLVVRASLSNYTVVNMFVSVKEENFRGSISKLPATTTKVHIEVLPDNHNEHTPVFGNDAYGASLEFSSETGTEVKITNFRATDADGHNVTYAIQTRNDRNNLEIDSQTGKISVHIKLDDTVPRVLELVVIAIDRSLHPKTGSCTVMITLHGYTETECVAKHEYSRLEQDSDQRKVFLGLFIAMAILLAVVSISAVFAIYKWRTVKRRTLYQENINMAHGKTTKASEQSGYDLLAAGSKDEETAYNKLKDRDFSSGVPNPSYVSSGPRPICTPPAEPVPDYDGAEDIQI
ncbi:fat-like cadherin-related tumor suppressor homolog isoform X2 [Haliotis rufescens]|uniref:fat-like cadherin-related tumor suppressor homolog isoform X2 n=1 Tax=Haliotis rufescens TaxID=6454 RepID=UPI00201FA55F|nr:fat-like cadherin-related tumor suppressor homolog isoform X2 [Haliotis rufescens]